LLLLFAAKLRIFEQSKSSEALKTHFSLFSFHLLGRLRLEIKFKIET